MAKILDVYFQKEKIGELEQDNQGDINFSYMKDWLDNPKAISISHSLPLQNKPFKKRECNAFFEGLLPEASARRLIAKNLGISANNDFSMLEKIGGECAGALTFLPPGEAIENKNEDYHALTEKELAAILRELPSRPLLAGKQGVRLSLAGVQDKLAVYVKDGVTCIPLHNAPSTHILKPDFGHYKGIIYNEAFCLNLANHIGLSTATAEVKNAEDLHYLLIKRYDRKYVSAAKIERIHQEDFCQALNIPSRNKYQNEGGPSLKQCFDLIRMASASPVIDLDKMLNGVIFNYFIGNCDAHGKNFSLLYDEHPQLAPFYDLICTTYYPELSQKMAMKLGGNYKIKDILFRNFDKFAEEVGFSKLGVQKRIKKLQELIIDGLSTIKLEHQVQNEIAQLIKKQCQRLKF